MFYHRGRKTFSAAGCQSGARLTSAPVTSRDSEGEGEGWEVEGLSTGEVLQDTGDLPPPPATPPVFPPRQQSRGEQQQQQEQEQEQEQEEEEQEEGEVLQPGS